jgi:hypothetical protein
VAAPKRYLVPAPLLGTEWKLNVIKGIRAAHSSSPLIRRRLRSDRRRRLDIDKLLGHIRKKRWPILIGPSLRSAEKAVRYACRYTKRPVLAEGRIVKFEQGYVTYRFKDYHKGVCRASRSSLCWSSWIGYFNTFPNSIFDKCVTMDYSLTPSAPSS